MSRLAFIGRPWIAFDAANRQHRQWFAEFQKTRTWGRCPVRFIVPDDHGDLLMMIQTRLIDYYVNKEFDAGRVRGCGAKATKIGYPKEVDSSNV